MVLLFFIVNTQGARSILFLSKGSPVGQILPASGSGTGMAELEPPLVDVKGIDEARNSCSWLNASAFGSLGDGARLTIKSSRSVVTKCSPPTISYGSKRGIIGRLYGARLRLTSAMFFKVRRTSQWCSCLETFNSLRICSRLAFSTYCTNLPLHFFHASVIHNQLLAKSYV